MLYDQHLEPISTEVTVGTPCLINPSLQPPRFTILHKTPHFHTPFAPARLRSKLPALIFDFLD